ncbi:MAG: HDOD domain-containing protein [Labilithrix sp.]|nr:HDOD domain-containing protein [Labilithrix sp.]
MMAPRRVLLVDDEPRIVAGLQRLLRPHRALWDVSVATSAHEALAILDDQSFDVIVSDMRMPVMDGAAFLRVAREKYPATMRIVLSGQTDATAAERVVPVAHQFLSKPTDPVILLETLRRVADTRGDIADPRVHAAVGGIDALPSLPSICRELIELVSREDSGVEEIVHVVQREPAIVLKLLQVVNSSFFGLRRRICSVLEAITYLGTERLKNLVMSLSIVNSLPPRATRFDATEFHRHSLEVARVARLVAGGGERAETSFVAALLHDVGKLVMASTMPAVYNEIAAHAEASGVSFEEAERQRGDSGHVKVGACLLELWGLPFPVVEAIVGHAKAPALEGAGLQSRDAVYIAHRLVEPGLEPLGTDADRAYLERVGVLARLPELIAEAGEGLET